MLRWSDQSRHPRLKAGSRQRLGVLHEPCQRLRDVLSRRRCRQIPFNIFDGSQEAIQQPLEFLERTTIDNHIVVVESVGLGQLPCHVRLLLTAISTERPWSTRSLTGFNGPTTPATPQGSVSSATHAFGQFRHVTILSNIAGVGPTIRGRPVLATGVTR